MSDGKKTKQELIAEIEALRQELTRRERDSAEGEQDLSSEPSFARPMTRREVLGGWIAPVILSIPLAAATRSGAVRAEPVPETQAPTPQPPTSAPTPQPPTPAPTPFPTGPAPTPQPPTPAPTPVPTAFPTVVPTAAAPTPAARPIPALGAAGAAALGAGLAALGAKALKRRGSAGDDPDAGGAAEGEDEGNGKDKTK